MKYRQEIEIALPREKVIELFDSTENLYKWQPGLIAFEYLSGEPGQVGAKSQMKHKMGKREIEMIETITERDLPDLFTATYEAKNVWNQVRNRFVALGSEKTEWICENEFRCTGLFMRLMTKLMPGAFKKETYKYMTQFKDFAETEAGR